MATLAVAALGVQAIGSIVGGIRQDKISKYNAKVSEQAAISAEKKAEFDETAHRERVRKALSTQRTRIAKSGIDVTGSPLLAIEESAAAGEMDALAIRFGGEVESERLRSQAKGERFAGKSAKRASFLSAGGSLLSAGAQFNKRTG